MESGSRGQTSSTSHVNSSSVCLKTKHGGFPEEGSASRLQPLPQPAACSWPPAARQPSQSREPFLEINPYPDLSVSVCPHADASAHLYLPVNLYSSTDVSASLCPCTCIVHVPICLLLILFLWRPWQIRRQQTQAPTMRTSDCAGICVETWPRSGRVKG